MVLEALPDTQDTNHFDKNNLIAISIVIHENDVYGAHKFNAIATTKVGNEERKKPTKLKKNTRTVG